MLSTSTDAFGKTGTWPCVDSRLGLVGLFLHDFHDHATGSGAALGGGVDGDGLLCSARIFFSMDVDPARQKGTR